MSRCVISHFWQTRTNVLGVFCSSRGRNQLCKVLAPSVKGFGFCEGSKFEHCHSNSMSTLTQCVNYRSQCDWAMCCELHFSGAFGETGWQWREDRAIGDLPQRNVGNCLRWRILQQFRQSGLFQPRIRVIRHLLMGGLSLNWTSFPFWGAVVQSINQSIMNFQSGLSI